MDTPDRDQTHTHKMIETYDRLIKRYPDSPFTIEAEKRIQEGRDLLAEHELVVANWYLRTGHIRQAVNRLEVIVTLYPDTAVYPMAAARLARELPKLPKVSESQAVVSAAPWWKRLWPF